MGNSLNLKSKIIRFTTWLILMFAVFWICLPPINAKSTGFWSFVCFGIISFVLINAFSYIKAAFKAFKLDKSGYLVKTDTGFSFKKVGKPLKISLLIIGAIIVFSIIMNIIGCKLFNAKRYTNLITVKDGNFSQDVAELKMSQIPVVDRDSSVALGKRKLGEMTDLVSQFEIADNYTQINYKDSPVRITPLAYGDIIKWFNNQKQGVPGYIKIDMATQDATLVRLENGIKYSESEYFLRDINRYLRFKYPTKIFDNLSFEIDEQGTPYWVASIVKYRIGYWNGSDISAAVLVNAVTGETTYYNFNEIPQWVDQVFNSEMIITQLNYNGTYRNGFWNSIFGQKNVIETTDGYNYLAIDDDVWLYTGMTSVVGDQSNIGFVLVNLRTKETRFYQIPSATEHSAMDSAKGQVQEKKYSATFPILLNISNRPTYFMSLKDNAGLVKIYAFVDVQQYQVVGTGSTVAKAKEDYEVKITAADIDLGETTTAKTTTVNGVVDAVSSAVINGNTKYFILLKNNPTVYSADITLNDHLPFVKSGDSISLELETITTVGSQQNDNSTEKTTVKSITVK